jgi:primosomal protein N''
METKYILHDIISDEYLMHDDFFDRQYFNKIGNNLPLCFNDENDAWSTLNNIVETSKVNETANPLLNRIW